MQSLLRQIPFSFSIQEEMTFENYFKGRNAEVVSHLKAMIDENMLENSYICSPHGLGCSHLLQAACRYANTKAMSSIYIPLSQSARLPPDTLNSLAHIQLICIDDLHSIAGAFLWEESLFHLYNRVQEKNGRLIIAANDLPKAIKISLPDLVSRLSWGMVYQLQELTDDEKMHMLIMRATRRGMMLSEEVSRYILTHCPRHMSTLMTALNVLDKASLAAQRRLTIPFVKEILQI